MYIEYTTGQKKWMRMRVYACVRRTTGNLAALSESLLFRLFFQEKTVCYSVASRLLKFDRRRAVIGLQIILSFPLTYKHVIIVGHLHLKTGHPGPSVRRLGLVSSVTGLNLKLEA
jgi:hypothetical protein